LQKPFIYQESEGRRTEIAGGYVLKSNNRVRFEIGKYDPNQPLVIDPIVTLGYSTYLGGSQFDGAIAIAVDGAGNVVITGGTRSLNFPTSAAIQTVHNGGDIDHFVSKLSPDGSTLIYSTYLGGTGSEGVNGGAIAADAAGNAYVGAATSSSDFPITVGAFQTVLHSGWDPYVAKLSPYGLLVYSTFLGGTYVDAINAIAVNAAGNVYVTGVTTSPDFPTLNPIMPTSMGEDAFVAKLNVAGSGLIYSTFLGGSGHDSGQGITVDGEGNAYVTGLTLAANFPVINAAQPTIDPTLCYPNAICGDAFVTKINAAGSAFAYSTFLGGTARDRGLDIPAYDARSFLGFFAAGKDVLRVWEEYLDYILVTLQGEGGQRGFGIPLDLAEGVWNYNKTYILTHVCGNGSAPVGLCQ
jgi:Beta-propeller repeat